MTDRLILRHRTKDKHCYRRPTGDYYTLTYDADGGCVYVFITRWDFDRLSRDPAWERVDEDWRLPV